MKKTSFLMALACFGLLITGCNPGSTPSESKPTSTSGNASTSSKPSTSTQSSSSTSSVIPDPETYYEVEFGAENEGEDLMEIFKSLPFDNPARRQFDNIRLGSEKTFANILVSLAAKLSAFDSEDIAALTACNSFEFNDLAKEKSVVYFITPESHGTYDFLIRSNRRNIWWKDGTNYYG